MIKIRGISKKYKNYTVLNDINFSLQKGNVLGILGPNGAGKSTLLKILALVLDADEGTYHLSGADAKKHKKMLHQLIGFVPQDLALYEELSVLDNLIYWSNIPWSKSQSKIEHLLTSFELQELKNKKVSTLSGGMKRRLNLAVAVINTPQLLIMDEPFVGVDIFQLSLLRSYLSNLSKNGVTQVITSHTASAVLDILDNVMILNHGRIKFYGTVQEFLNICNNDLHQIDNTIIRIMNT